MSIRCNGYIRMRIYDMKIEEYNVIKYLVSLITQVSSSM